MFQKKKKNYLREKAVIKKILREFGMFWFQEVKVSSPDYQNMNTEAALKDFLLRIEHYKERYVVFINNIA